MTQETVAAAPPSVGRTWAIIAAIAVLVAAYMAMGAVLKITPLFAGYFFLLYWVGIKHAAPKEFAPTLLGALAGLALAWLLHVVPIAFGTAGMISVIALVVAAIYVQIRNSLPLIINLSFMLFMTLGTVPPVAGEGDFLGMALAVLLAAGFFGGMLFLATRFGKGRQLATEPA